MENLKCNYRQDTDFILIPYVQRKNEIIEAKTMLNNSGRESTKLISIIQNDEVSLFFLVDYKGVI